MAISSHKKRTQKHNSNSNNALLIKQIHTKVPNYQSSLFHYCSYNVTECCNSEKAPNNTFPSFLYTIYNVK